MYVHIYITYNIWRIEWERLRCIRSYVCYRCNYVKVSTLRQKWKRNVDKFSDDRLVFSRRDNAKLYVHGISIDRHVQRKLTAERHWERKREKESTTDHPTRRIFPSPFNDLKRRKNDRVVGGITIIRRRLPTRKSSH